MPDDPRESSFMRAAEAEVERLGRAARLHKLQIRILGAVTALLLIVAALSGYEFTQIHDNAVTACQQGNAYRTASTNIWDSFIALAVAGNPQAKAEAPAFINAVVNSSADPHARAVAANFVDNLIGGAKDNPQIRNEIAVFKAYIAQVNKPRDCTQIYSLNG